jgi:hypothetical protein
MSNDDIKATVKTIVYELRETFPKFFTDYEIGAKLLPKTTECLNRLLENIPDNKEIINIQWSIIDVEMKAEIMGVELTYDQKLSVMRLVENQHDAELGMSWNNIENAINIILSRNG